MPKDLEINTEDDCIDAILDAPKADRLSAPEDQPLPRTPRLPEYVRHG